MHGGLGSLIALSLFAGACLYVCPEGGARRVLKLLCAAMLTAAVLAPLRELDYDLLSLEQARFEGAEAEITRRASRSGESLQRLLVKENVENYIRTQGQALGLRVESAEAELRQDERGELLPWAVTIRAAGADTEAERLAGLLRTELGIPAERQEWILNE